jgi:hypothetical protein
MVDFDLIIYFSEKHINITVVKAKDFEEAKLLAYKKFSHRTIQKIEPYFKGQFSLNK